MWWPSVRAARSIPRFWSQCRGLSTSSSLCAERAIVFRRNGNPQDVLESVSFPTLPPPGPHTVNVKFLLSTVNPADINVIEGVYPSKPSPNVTIASARSAVDQPVFVAGNEGLAEITAVGKDVAGLRESDWVIITKEGAGTWASSANLGVDDVLKIPGKRGHNFTQVHGATIKVNPPTAYVMLQDFVQLSEGDWVLQNGANSSVGQAVIQIAAARGIKTINLVRDRPEVELLKKQLEKLGADLVLTYGELSDPSVMGKVRSWTNDRPIRLALNCVGGRETMHMTKLLGHDAHLVSYGAMSKEPLALPTSLFIFKNLTCHGFWLSRWYRDRTSEERQKLFQDLTRLVSEGKLKEPEYEIVTLEAKETDQSITQKVRDVISRIGQGRYGRKVLWRIERAAD